MKGMFWNCSNLTEIHTQVFDTSKVTNFDNMFTNCKKVTSLILTKFNTLNCNNNFEDMFIRCNDNLKVMISKNIENYENLLDLIIKSHINIKF